MRALVLLLGLSAISPGEIVDRVAANLGLQVITESQIVEEIRVLAYIDNVPVDLSLDNRRKALDRLIDQTLVRRELEFTRFAPLSDAEMAPVMEPLAPRLASLAQYRIKVDELKRHVAWTLTMLRFIEYRFQPSIQISSAQLQQEYQRQLRGTPDLPPFEQVQADIEKIVRQRLVDAALDRWLGEVRTQNSIVYHGEYVL